MSTPSRDRAVRFEIRRVTLAFSARRALLSYPIDAEIPAAAKLLTVTMQICP